MFFVGRAVIVKPAPPNAKIVCRRFNTASSGLASPIDLGPSFLMTSNAHIMPASVVATPSFAVFSFAGFNYPGTTVVVSTS